MLAVLGVFLIVISLADAFVTMLTMRGGGPITNSWQRLLWRSLLTLHRERPIHRALSYAGPIMMVASIAIWFFMFAVGWALVFRQHPPSVISFQSGASATLWETVYFVGAAASSSGYGDFVASGPPWTLLANMLTASATFLLTVSLSYILAVVGNAVTNRSIAKRVGVLGATPAEIVLNSWTHGNARVMDQRWMGLLDECNTQVQKLLVYPVLHYFHSSSSERSLSLALLRLCDAVFLVSQTEQDDDSPPPCVEKAVQGVTREVVEIKREGAYEADEFEAKFEDHLSYEAAAEIDRGTVDEECFDAALQEYRPQRARLLAVCAADGWGRLEDLTPSRSSDR